MSVDVELTMEDDDGWETEKETYLENVTSEQFGGCISEVKPISM